MKKLKKLMYLNLFIILCVLSGCAKKEKITIDNISDQKKDKIENYVENLTKNEYIDEIKNSDIVSPYALINAFNVNYDLALSLYDKKKLAIPVNINELKSGKMIFTDKDNKQTIIDGNYAFFTEKIDEKLDKQKKEEIDRTNLVCAINQKDSLYIPYGISSGIDEETKQPIPPLVSNYFVVGNIESVTGDKKYNILIKDARLIPATTYKALEPIAMEEKENVVLDIDSGENISEKVKKYYWNDIDFDLNGICDKFVIQTNEYNPSSSFDKLVFNKIFNKIKTPLQSVIQFVYNDKNLKINFNFPLKINSIDLVKTTAFDGSYINLFKFELLGKNKTEINYKENSKEIDNTFSNLSQNPFYLENQYYLCQGNKNGINSFKIKLLDGRETESINSDMIYMKNIDIDELGNITGDIYVKAIYPFDYYYKTSLRIMSSNVIMEIPNDNYIFYDIDNFYENGTFKTSYDLKEYKFNSKIDLPIATDKKIFNKYEITSLNSNPINTGYGISEKDNKKINIFKTLNQKFSIIKIEKDEINDFYWVYIGNEKLKGYIPVNLNNYITYKDTDINILTKENNKTYKLKDLFNLK